MTLTEFLLARIAEDEGRAKWRTYVSTEKDDDGWWVRKPFDCHHADLRRLSECHAKRRIVERLEPITEADDGCVCDRCMTLRDLASVYADHPDYRDEWVL